MLLNFLPICKIISEHICLQANIIAQFIMIISQRIIPGLRRPWWCVHLGQWTFMSALPRNHTNVGIFKRLL